MIELDFQLALQPFTLHVAHRLTGRVTAVLGPSGCGKTSLLEGIAGLRRLATGRIAVGGTVFLDSEKRTWLPPERREVGYVPQEPALFPHLDVQGNICYGLRGSRAASRLVDETVELLELGPLQARYPRTLSGGEAQRVALARALVTKPRLLLLDEPLAALDAELRGRILPYLMRVRDEAHIPMIYVTHHVGEALALADEAVVLQRGHVEGKGPIREVLTPKFVTSIHGGATFENVVHGFVVAIHSEGGTATLEPRAKGARGDPPKLAVPGARDLQVGQHVTYRVKSEDILLLRQAPQGISARNVFPARVVDVESFRSDVMVRLETGGIEWLALVTPAAVRDLAIETGAEIWMAIKTHAFVRLG